MKERPILFSAPMVRAILDGKKTQTRRIVKVPGVDMVHCMIQHGKVTHWPGDDAVSLPLPACPYGVAGDRLWVRETMEEAGYWSRASPDDDNWSKWDGGGQLDGWIWYSADGEPTKPIPAGWQWRVWPSIHTRREWSRLTLEVTDVRVEQLHDIAEPDARREGIDCELHPGRVDCGCSFAVARFQSLWLDINGAHSWDANPWVWVVSFRRILPP